MKPRRLEGKEEPPPKESRTSLAAELETRGEDQADSLETSITRHRVLEDREILEARTGEADALKISKAALPCLYSNNSNENASSRLSSQARKSASALAWNVQTMAEKWGLEHLGFLTLTFADNVLNGREAQRRFNSLSSGVLRERYPAYIRVMERQRSGRIHYHLLVVMGSDIRTGFDFTAIARHDYRSAGPQLRKEWVFWRRTAKEYGFGRTELLPVKSTSEGIARYVGKYISKHLQARQDDDKGLRLVEYSQNARMASTRFQFATKGAASWRRKLKLFASMICKARGYPVPSMQALSKLLGPRWAYQWREFILSLPDPLACCEA